MIISASVSISLTSSTVLSKYKVPVNPGANTSCFRSTKTLLDRYIQKEKKICSKLMIELVAMQDSLTTWSRGAF